MRLADVRFEHAGPVVVARLSGEIDMSNATDLLDALSYRVSNEAAGLVLDLTDLEYVDSAGIKLIFELRERLLDRGQRLGLVVPGESVVGPALHVAAVPRTVETRETVDDAVDRVRA